MAAIIKTSDPQKAIILGLWCWKTKGVNAKDSKIHTINEIILGKTTLRILQKCQTPKTQYEQHVRWRSSNSCHRRTYQSWHHSEWILAAQKKELVSGPSNHLASLEIVCPFLRSPKRLLGKFQFWQNGMERNHPERQWIKSIPLNGEKVTLNGKKDRQKSISIGLPTCSVN